MNSGNDPIRYENADFAISMAIDNCPASTVIYELVRNTIENVVQRADQPGPIEWFTESIDGVPKLGLYNEGPGMSAHDLERLMNIAATGKTLGRKENFGQGAKLAGMKASPKGLTYRSCPGDGRAHEITLLMERVRGTDYSICVKQKHRFPDGEVANVIEVSEEMRGKGRDLAIGWTEVILIGKSAEHDTVQRLLHDPEERNNTRWLTRLVNQRFYRFPQGVRIDHCSIPSGEEYSRHAKGMHLGTLPYVEREETVDAQHSELGPVQIRYGQLRGDSGRVGPLAAYGLRSGDHVCLVYKEECFDVTFAWTKRAPAFGFFYGSGEFFVEILLPESAPIKMNPYRTALQGLGDEAEEVTCQEFAFLVKENRPPWVLEYLRRLEEGGQYRSLKDRVRRYMDRLKVQGSRTPIVTGDGVEPGTDDREGPTGGDGPNGEKPPRKKPTRTRGQPTGRFVIEDADALYVPLNETQWYDQMGGRAGEYVLDHNAIKLSLKHPAYVYAEQALHELFPGPEEYTVALAIFKEEYRFHAITLICRSYRYRNHDGWSVNDWHEAMTERAITLHMDDPDVLDRSIRRAKQRLATRYAEGTA